MNLNRIKINKLANVRKNISKWSGDSEKESKILKIDCELNLTRSLEKILTNKLEEKLQD